MSSLRERLRPFVPAAAGLVSALVACLVFLASAGDRVPQGARGPAAACAAALLASLVFPTLSVALAAPGPAGPAADARRWARLVAGALGGATFGALVFALAFARAAVLATLLSYLVTGACAVSFGALARAVGKALRSCVAGGLVAGASLLVMIAAPFWSRGLLASGAGGWLGKPLVGASPFLAAAIPWTGASAGWGFDPRWSRLLYRAWVGTDFPLAYPSWIACVTGHVLVGAAILAVADLPRVLRDRRDRRSPGAAE